MMTQIMDVFLLKRRSTSAITSPGYNLNELHVLVNIGVQMFKCYIIWLLLPYIVFYTFCMENEINPLMERITIANYGSTSVFNSTLERGLLKHRIYHTYDCSNKEIILKCPTPTEVIIIENSTFIPNINCFKSRFYRNIALINKKIDLRKVLNRRCSGFGNGKQCQFNLILDHPDSLSWHQSGLTEIHYRCTSKVQEILCTNSLLEVKVKKTGFISSVKYPKYYTGGQSCNVTLQAEPGQRIFLRFLDVNFRKNTNGECIDYVLVYERGRMLHKLCGELESDITMLSQSHVFNIQIQTSGRSIHPRRGLLAEYWPVGCIQNPLTGFAYVTFHNISHVTYSCPSGMGFIPDMSKSKTIICNGKEWSENIYTCNYIVEAQRYFPGLNQTSSQLNIVILIVLLILLMCVGSLVFIVKSNFWATHRIPILNSICVQAPIIPGALETSTNTTLQLHDCLDLFQLQKEELYLC
ncbi:uncharacterized protein [Lepeophtheirus salmonis]|uniref:uncharacterized protein isoform X1 n=2 Tax=Lepeophtheirus salmonis TaxID=72036 RepID=UPI001AE31689|nr:uncharacterized protein LOC121126625 isoform X1 [Lepeophtheirus salmonis]